ncbi:unnamed protein product [Orchesella dallaii]|uniref:Speckle-type POZ protein n=1 Tax=Orchesella dallaii TaxID=48710 RepID=A0ABP1R0I9_9HEXA
MSNNVFPIQNLLQVELDSFSFTWAINNYSFLNDLDQIDSPLFRGGPKTKHWWRLSVRPKKEYDSVKYFSLYLEFMEHGSWLDGIKSAPVRAHYKMSILNADGEPEVHACKLSIYCLLLSISPYFLSSDLLHFFIVQNKAVQTFTKEKSAWGLHRVITSADLVDPRRHLVVNDTVKIFCQVWVHGETKEKVAVHKGRLSEEQRTIIRKKQLANDFGKLFNQSIATDCTVSVGKNSFKSHKTILSARSPVFAAMFNANMIGRETANVNIPDFDNEVVKGMLEYLYTGETAVMASRAQELLQIAEKYNLEGLKEDCEYTIGNSLSKENVAGVLVLAHNHNAPILKCRAISFINWNKEELLKLKSFQDAVKAFAHTGLFADLYLGSKK